MGIVILGNRLHRGATVVKISVLVVLVLWLCLLCTGFVFCVVVLAVSAEFTLIVFTGAEFSELAMRML